MHKFCILHFLLITLAGSALGQHRFKLSGQVRSKSDSMGVSGDVFLLSQKDSTLLRSAIIDEGVFSIDSIQQGDYILRVSCMGYYPELLMISLTKDTSLLITLNNNTKTLKGISVVATKPVFSNQKGNILMNVNNTIMAEIPAAVDLLSKLPGILLSPDRQSISAVGKGEVIIYLDNQRITMNDLVSIPVSDIENIEIINNPSAKYDSDGRSVILVRKKIRKTDGIKIELSETASFKRFFNNYLETDINYKRKKLELKANLQYHQRKLWESNAYEFELNKENMISNYSILSEENSPQFQISTGAYYQINPDDYASITVNGRRRTSSYPNAANSYVKDGVTEQNIITTTENDNARNYLSSNVNYNKKLKKIKGELFFGAQYSTYAEDLTTDVYNKRNSSATNLDHIYDQQYRIKVFSAKIQFEKEFSNALLWQIGGSMSKSNANADSDVRDFNPERSTSFSYKYLEDNFSAFTSIEQKLNKFNYSLGIRFENAKVEGGYKGEDQLLVNRNIPSFFPKLSVSYSKDSISTWSVNFARSIQRPNFLNLSQITIYLNPFTNYSRNINLVPTFTNEASVSFQHRNKTFQLTYYHQKDPVFLSTEFNSQNKLITLIDRNFNSESGINLSVTLPVQYKSWSSTNVIVGGISEVNDPNAVLNRPKPAFYLYSGNQFKLPKNYNLLINAWYMSKTYTGLFEKNFQSSVDLGISRTFFEKLTCTIALNDIFRTLNTTQTFIIGDVYSKGTYYEDIREFSFSIKYRFGNIQSAYKNRDVDDNLNRIR